MKQENAAAKDGAPRNRMGAIACVFPPPQCRPPPHVLLRVLLGMTASAARRSGTVYGQAKTLQTSSSIYVLSSVDVGGLGMMHYFCVLVNRLFETSVPPPPPHNWVMLCSKLNRRRCLCCSHSGIAGVACAARRIRKQIFGCHPGANGFSG